MDGDAFPDGIGRVRGPLALHFDQARFAFIARSGASQTYLRVGMCFPLSCSLTNRNRKCNAAGYTDTGEHRRCPTAFKLKSNEKPTAAGSRRFQDFPA